MTESPSQQRRPPWLWLVVIPLVLLFAAWCGFWYYGASVAERTIAGWKEREANSGRVYTCATQTVGGFPFGLEFRCADVGIAVKASQQPIAEERSRVAQYFGIPLVFLPYMKGQRVGSTSELQVGEGTQDAPVGTTLAMIDQATKILNSVHKRMHASQAEEFQLLVRCFREHPESFWGKNRKPKKQWDEATFIAALDNCDLVPQADPNTASQTQRLMKVMALKQLQQLNPSMYDPIAIDTAALKAIGWSNPEQFLLPQSAQEKMPPEMMQKIEELKIKKQDADARMITAQANAQKAMQAEGGDPNKPPPPPNPEKVLDMQVKLEEIRQRGMDSKLDAINRKMDRESRERLAAIKLAEEIAANPAMLPIVNEIVDPAMLQRLESNEPDIAGLATQDISNQ